MLRQHLTAVRAAATIGGARVEGAELGSRSLVFEPGGVLPGEHRFAIGSAGSVGLVLQAVLPALLTASAPSRLLLEGGTHNPWAPPYDFLERAFLPLIGAMGPRVVAALERPGFYPAGGGRLRVEVEPAPKLAPLALAERGAITSRRARALLSRLPDHVGRRELERLASRCGWDRRELELVPCESDGPGNALVVEIASERLTEVFTAFGRRGIPAEAVADEAVAQLDRYLAAGVPVGEHLADQLLVPLAVAGAGSFVTLQPSSHLTTNAAVVERFLEVKVELEGIGPDRWRVSVAG